MEAPFWLNKWQRNEIGFNQAEANPFLVQHLDALGLASGATVFVPLCGKSVDIHWLLAQGLTLKGIELSETAIIDLFKDLKLEPQLSKVGALMRYRSGPLDIHVGDIFDLSAEILGPVDAVYDRAALVALPEAMRSRYADHLMAITDRAPQLLISFDYNQAHMAGPPFSVPEAMVSGYYQDHFAITRLDSAPVEGGLKGQCDALEQTWRLTPRSK